MPKKFRHSLGEDFYITRGLGCLCVFTREFVDKQLMTEMEQLGTGLRSLLDMDIVRLNRHYFRNMVLTGADSQNRVQLTLEHRKYAGIEDELVICGCGNFLEIWSPAALEEYEKSNDRPEDIIASGAALLPRQTFRAPGEGNAGGPQAGTP
jgi:MraZ protein